MERIHDVDYRRGVWEVSGRGRRGARIEVAISARTGRVLDIDYGRGRRGRGHGFGHGYDDHDRDWRRGW